MSTFLHFLKHARARDFSTHLQRLNACASVSFGDGPASELIGYIDTLPSRLRDQLQVECERIAAMVDDMGQAALMSLHDLRGGLKPIDSAHARAYWAFLHHPESFRQAEEARFADENQNARRMWDGFVGPAGIAIQSERAQLDDLQPGS